MKILIFNEFYTPYKVGGAEVSTQILAEGLVKLGNQVHVCTSGSGYVNTIINGVHVHRIPQSNIYWSFNKENQSIIHRSLWHLKDCYNISCKKDISNIINDISPDVIHTNVIAGFSVIIWQIAKKKSIPVVHTLRDYYLMCYKSTLYNNDKRCEEQCGLCNIVSIFRKISSKYVDTVVGISDFILQKHINNGYFQNSRFKTVIQNSVKPFANTLVVKRRKVIGYLGRIHHSKGIEILLSSFLRLSMNEYSVEIAGEGNPEYVSKLKQKYSINDKIKFVGKVESYNFLSTIEVLVVPSLWDEPFGRVIVEANSCGCPVIVSNRGGMPELIKEGCNGLVFDIDDKDSLKNMLNNYIRGKISFSLGNIKLDCYNEEFVANQYVNVYQKVLDSCKSRLNLYGIL